VKDIKAIIAQQNNAKSELSWSAKTSVNLNNAATGLRFGIGDARPRSRAYTKNVDRRSS
jgi:hypothetical protein